VPQWDESSLLKVRNALAVLASTVSDTSGFFGDKDKLDRLDYLMGTAAGRRGNPKEAAMYFTYSPALPAEIIGSRMLTGGAVLVKRTDGELKLVLDETARRTDIDRIVELELDRDAFATSLLWPSLRHFVLGPWLHPVSKLRRVRTSSSLCPTITPLMRSAPTGGGWRIWT
jgi:hypothetical protein